MLALIDIRTVFLLMTLVALVAGVAMFLLWRLNRAEASAKVWAGASLLVAAGQALLSLRGIATDFMSVVLANVTIAFGHGLHVVGIDAYLERKPRRWIAYSAAGVILAVFPWFTYVRPDTAAR
jgi:hypothetical protein